ncbi:MAG: hypothetical protein PHF63_10785 [Herbinix sp.]|nr:hypothetical protein [Herbinix sp.]
MEKIFALYDSDIFYATRFLEYFQRKNEYDIEITAFTRMESLEEFLRLHPIEILLESDQITRKDFNSQNIKYIYQLTDKLCKDTDTGYPLVYKYQSAKEIMEEIMADYLKKENKTRINYESTNQMQIISVFSPLPSIQKMSFAWSISSLLSEQNKVLFVMLDLFPIPLFNPLDHTSQSITEFIYYLKENSNITVKMESLLGRNGNLSYLAGILNGADILSLSKEDMRKWTQELRRHNDYQTVVFYLGCYTEAMAELMNISDTVLVTIMDNPYEIAVQKEWERQMNQLGIPIKQEIFQTIGLQGEEELGHIPLTIQELMNSDSWTEARRYLNYS